MPHPAFPPRRRRLLAAAACVAVALALAGGCGGGSNGGSADVGQPQRSGGFGRDAMSNVPVPPDATAEGNAITERGATTQAFRVPGTQGADLVRTYQLLAGQEGWKTISDPAASGATDWTMTLSKGTSTLLVTTAPIDDGSRDTELSLEVSAG